ncbi:DUF2510 domain-containing protein [Actinomarinicola tropica]|uniref:DUF2510 domain-containing protein n=1 Tax=Actinomarinicola tropica TaxID=2789776 RepID=UPI001E4A515D|nr:DUF2510 domain-containing protein [Actinomarinicola tropica]
MSDRPGAGWYPDPSDPAQQRWWDGTAWTDQVSGAGGAPGVSTSPAATPGRVELAERLMRARPEGSVGVAVAAAGGVLGVLGAFVTISETDGRTPSNLVAVLVLLAAYALALAGPAWTRPAALAGGVVAPLVLAGNLAPELDGRMAIILPALLAGGAWLAMFLAPGLRGAPVLVAGALLAAWAAFTGATAPTNDAFRSVEVYGMGGTGYWDAPVNPIGQGESTLVVALVVVCVAAVLDRRGWRVLATPFIAVGVVLGFVGVSSVTSGVDSIAASAVLVIAVGGVIAVVGGSGRRRGSTWIGTGLAVAGIVALLADLVDDPTGAGVLLVLIAAGLVAGSQAIERAVAPAVASGEETPSRPEAF